MTADLAATVAGLRDGDRVRATFVDDDLTLIAEGPVFVSADGRSMEVSIGRTLLRHWDNLVDQCLTAVEVLPPALPPEPPVGSGVFHDGVLWHHDTDNPTNDPWFAIINGVSARAAWADIQPCVPAVPAPAPNPSGWFSGWKDGWFPMGTFVDYPWLVTEGSPERDESGLPKWERPVPLGYRPSSTDEPDVPDGSLAVFRDNDGRPLPAYKWGDGTWNGWPWSRWTDLYDAPSGFFRAGGAS